VYSNQATNNTFLYVIATCDSLFFSKAGAIFGAANLTILLVVLAFKRYAFTSLRCVNTAVGRNRPFTVYEPIG
jgi:hypothetical protein